MSFDAVAITASGIWKFGLSYKYTTAQLFCWIYSNRKLSLANFIRYKQKIAYQERRNLEISLPAKLESDFTEVIIPKSSNLTIGSIYKHPTFMINKFTNDIMPPLL